MRADVKLVITAKDVEQFNLVPGARLSAGIGWRSLIHRALLGLKGLPIRAIIERDGGLSIEAEGLSDRDRMHLLDVRMHSRYVCELCGFEGKQIDDGQVDSSPRARCSAHRDWRTSPPFPAGQPTDPMEARLAISLYEREFLRREALWSLGGCNSRELALRLKQLDLIERLDAQYPLGVAAASTVHEVASNVPHIEFRNEPGLRVRVCDIPEPWRTRMELASTGSTMSLNAFYLHDWQKFLALWEREHQELLRLQATLSEE
ncbi:hypothetical protein [Geopseudomonas aromaticivorans]